MPPKKITPKTTQDIAPIRTTPTAEEDRVVGQQMAEFLSQLRAEFLESEGPSAPNAVKYKKGARAKMQKMLAGCATQTWADTTMDQFDLALKEYNANSGKPSVVFLI